MTSHKLIEHALTKTDPAHLLEIFAKALPATKVADILRASNENLLPCIGWSDEKDVDLIASLFEKLDLTTQAILVGTLAESLEGK